MGVGGLLDMPMAKIRFIEIVHPRLFGMPAVNVHATTLHPTRLGAADLPQAHATMSRAVLIVDRHGTIKAGFTARFPRGCKLHLSSSPGVGVSRDMRLTWLIYIGVRKDCQQTIRKNFRSPPGRFPGVDWVGYSAIQAMYLMGMYPLPVSSEYIRKPLTCTVHSP